MRYENKNLDPKYRNKMWLKGKIDKIKSINGKTMPLDDNWNMHKSIFKDRVQILRTSFFLGQIVN